MPVPQFYEMFNAFLDAIRRLGGSGSIREVTKEVIENLNLSDDVAEQLHGNGPQTELAYRLGWTRTYLKNYGLLENSGGVIWTLTPKGRELTSVDASDVMKHARELWRKRRENKMSIEQTTAGAADDGPDEWRENLLSILQKMDPDRFERLCQRLLRESGFIEVEVTGRTGDGGIDGRGIIRLAGLVSFPVLFQCKRYTGSVSASQVRDFRGALEGRADKGLFITTGTFTVGASREATRAGATPIDLIDGALLTDKLQELGLGVGTKEVVVVDREFFEGI